MRRRTALGCVGALVVALMAVAAGCAPSGDTEAAKPAPLPTRPGADAQPSPTEAPPPPTVTANAPTVAPLRQQQSATATVVASPTPAAMVVASPFATSTNDDIVGPAVVVGDTVFKVDVASTPAERAVGLSGRESLAHMSGMLFLYPTGSPYSYWTKGMLFAIDILWIASDCAVAEITSDLPPTPADAPDSDVIRASPTVDAAHVLEIAAGASEKHGLRAGDAVSFVGIAVPAGDACAPKANVGR